VYALSVIAALLAAPVAAQSPFTLGADLPVDPEALVERIAADIEVIRELEFTERISVDQQSVEEFEAYLDREMARSLPPERAEVFGRVIETLGLFRGPRIDDAVGLMKMVMSSQVAAYYDPEASEFRVLVGNAPPAMLGPLFAHELYHGLQDQHFDLDAYLLDGIDAGLNDDQLFARQAVVEGEATYMMTLWSLREATGQIPSGFALSMAVGLQTALDAAGLQALPLEGLMPEGFSEEYQAMLAAMDQIPPFLMESMLGTYMKGMGFVHRVARTDWDAVARLYSDPPQSSEQILHPEKYLNRDPPVAVEFQGFESSTLLQDWTLLDSNVIGEFQWRIIFDEFEMSDRSARVAAGWDGDRFAVYQRGDRLLLLLYTVWDSGSDASDFALAYRELLDRKYPSDESVSAVVVRDAAVLVVEGGDAADTQALVELLAGAETAEQGG